MKFLFERKEWRRIRRDSSFLTFLRNYWTKKRTKFEWKIPLHHSCNNFAQFLLFSFLLRFFSYIFLFDWRSTKILFRNWIPPHRLLPTINNKHPITPLLYIFKTCLQTPSFKYHTKINIAFNIRVFLFPPRNSSPPCSLDPILSIREERSRTRRGDSRTTGYPWAVFTQGGCTNFRYCKKLTGAGWKGIDLARVPATR